MKTGKATIQKYLVLVPHNETRQILRKYSDELIKNGLKGVMPFPFVAPLKELEKPLSPEELKRYAHELRKEMGNEKFNGEEMDSVLFKVGNKELKLYGVKIKTTEDTSNLRFASTKAVVGIFLSNNKDLPPPPQLSFRAAAVANFYIKPITNGFKWKVGKLYWLPKKID